MKCQCKAVELAGAASMTVGDGIIHQPHLCIKLTTPSPATWPAETTGSKALAEVRPKFNPTAKESAERRALKLTVQLKSWLCTERETALTELTAIIAENEELKKSLDWLNTVDGMDWFSCCEYGEATLEAIQSARKGA